jgi:hypothetical protein
MKTMSCTPVMGLALGIITLHEIPCLDCWHVENLIVTWRTRAAYFKSATNVIRNRIVGPSSWNGTVGSNKSNIYHICSFRGGNVKSGQVWGNRFEAGGGTRDWEPQPVCKAKAIHSRIIYTRYGGARAFAHCVQAAGKPLLSASGARIRSNKGIDRINIGWVRNGSYNFYKPLTDVLIEACPGESTYSLRYR